MFESVTGTAASQTEQMGQLLTLKGSAPVVDRVGGAAARDEFQDLRPHAQRVSPAGKAATQCPVGA